MTQIRGKIVKKTFLSLCISDRNPKKQPNKKE